MTPAEIFYADELKAFAALDRKSPPPHSPVLFYGSSSIRLWDTLAADFPDLPVMNRGFGGSTLADCVEFTARLVVPYSPRSVLFYAGDNDLDQGAKPVEVMNRFARLVHLIHRDLRGIPVTFIAIKPSPARWWNVSKIIETNRLVAAFIGENSALHFLDAFPLMLAADGLPRADFYLEDGLHLNPLGYRAWARLIRENATL